MSRTKFFKKLADELKSGRIAGFAEPTFEDVVVVMLAKDHDPKADAHIWHQRVNQSEARSLGCGGCDLPVVMSNGMYSRLIAGTIDPKKVLCIGCATDRAKAAAVPHDDEPPQPDADVRGKDERLGL